MRPTVGAVLTRAAIERVLEARVSLIQYRILQVFEREREASAKTIAAALENCSIPLAAYHLGELYDRGLIRITRKVPVRGATQTFLQLSRKGKRLLPS